MNLGKIAEGITGAALIAFVPDEPIGLPLGALLLADAFGVKL